jgi:hypothetical protein
MTFERAMLLFGVVVGIFLLVFGIVQYQLGIPSWKLSFCVGFGIILGSFGTVANVSTKIWTITGAGATTVVLYWVTTISGQQYTMGIINGDFPDGTVAYVRDVQDLPGGFTENKRNYRVVLFESQLQSGFLEVEVKRPSDNIPIIIKVKRDYVDKIISQGKGFTWILQGTDLVDTDGKRVPVIGEFSRNDNGGSSRFALINAAWAQAAPQSPSADAQKLANSLSSPDYQARRDARNTLIDMDIPAIRPVLDVLAQQADPASDKTFEFYNVLTNIQRKNERNSTGIRTVLSDKDFPLLMKGVGSHEKEIRLLATEFLFGISDKRALGPSLELLQSTTNQDAQWNTVLIIKSFFSNLPRKEQQNAAESLKAANVGPKTKAQIDSFVK